jgi:hypothetical protein
LPQAEWFQFEELSFSRFHLNASKSLRSAGASALMRAAHA